MTPVGSIGSTVNLFAPFATVSLHHVWAWVEHGTGKFLTEVVRETRSFSANMCNDSEAFFDMVPTPAANYVGTGVGQFDDILWVGEALRPTQFAKAVWIGTWVGGQVLHSDGVDTNTRLGQNEAKSALVQETIVANIPVFHAGGDIVPISTLPDANQCLIMSIDVIAINIFERGALGPSRIVQVENVGKGQTVNIEGEFGIQAISASQLAPFVDVDNDYRPSNNNILPLLDRLYSSQHNEYFKRIYSGTPNGNSQGNDDGEWPKIVEIIQGLTLDNFKTSTSPFVVSLRKAGVLGSSMRFAMSKMVQHHLASAIPHIVDTVLEHVQQPTMRSHRTEGVPFASRRDEPEQEYEAGGFGLGGILGTIAGTAAKALGASDAVASTVGQVGGHVGDLLPMLFADGDYGADGAFGTSGDPYGARGMFGTSGDPYGATGALIPYNASGRLKEPDDPALGFLRGGDHGIWSKRFGSILTPSSYLPWQRKVNAWDKHTTSYLTEQQQIQLASWSALFTSNPMDPQLFSWQNPDSEANGVGYMLLTQTTFARARPEYQAAVAQAGLYVAPDNEDAKPPALMMLQGLRSHFGFIIPSALWVEYDSAYKGFTKAVFESARQERDFRGVKKLLTHIMSAQEKDGLAWHYRGALVEGHRYLRDVMLNILYTYWKTTTKLRVVPNAFVTKYARVQLDQALSVIQSGKPQFQVIKREVKPERGVSQAAAAPPRQFMLAPTPLSLTRAEGGVAPGW